MILNDVTKLPASLAFINIYICDARGTKIAIDMGTIFILDLLEFSKWPKILFFENFFYKFQISPNATLKTYHK